jgi:hypothetical protein
MDSLREAVAEYWTPGLLTAFAAAMLRYFRPRRIIGWLSAVKERETLLAMLEHEKQSGLYWRRQAQQCIEQFQREYQAEAAEDAASDHALHAGGGATSSNCEDGQTRTERLTG